MGFDLKDYDPVESRLEKFWIDHKATGGRVWTKREPSEPGQYIIRAEIYTDSKDFRPAATGYAEEKEGGRGVNSTSALENCETSAIGRALANLGYAAKGKRPSREETSKASASRATSGAGGTATGFTSPAPVPASQRPAELEGAVGEVKGGGSVFQGEASDPSPYDRDGLWADLHTLYGTTPKIIGHINSATGKRYKPSDEADITTEELELTVAAAKEGVTA